MASAERKFECKVEWKKSDTLQTALRVYRLAEMVFPMFSAVRPAKRNYLCGAVTCLFCCSCFVYFRPESLRVVLRKWW